jgi:general secretion pathway protein K
MKRQRGVALLVVLLILTVMVVVATNISNRFHTELFRTSNLIRQNQAKWYAVGAEALVIKTLNQDIKDSPTRTHLGQYWASQGQVFPVDEGTIHGEIRDSQACYNVNGINSSASTNPNELPYSADVFKHLLLNLQVDEFEASQITDALRDWVDADDQPVTGLGAEDSWYQSLKVPYLTANAPMADISELRLVRGVSASLYRRLLPMVCALPSVASSTGELKINVNTLRETQAPLLAAMFLGQMSNEEALAILQDRPKDGWESATTFMTLAAVMNANAGLGDKAQKAVDVVSHFFEARLQVDMDEVQVRFITLFKRQTNNKVSVIRRQYGGLE